MKLKLVFLDKLFTVLTQFRNKIIPIFFRTTSNGVGRASRGFVQPVASYKQGLVLEPWLVPWPSFGTASARRRPTIRRRSVEALVDEGDEAGQARERGQFGSEEVDVVTRVTCLVRPTGASKESHLQSQV